MSDKIIPCIWFKYENGHLAQVISYCKEPFRVNFEPQFIVSPGNISGKHTDMCEIDVFDKKYSLLNTSEEHHPFFTYRAVATITSSSQDVLMDFSRYSVYDRTRIANASEFCIYEN